MFTYRNTPFKESPRSLKESIVEKFESIESAIRRETFEESGLNVQFPKFIGDCRYLNSLKNEKHHRHFFHYQPEYEIDNTWVFTVKGSGEDKNLVFEYFWIKCNIAEKVLEIDQGAMIKYI